MAALEMPVSHRLVFQLLLEIILHESTYMYIYVIVCNCFLLFPSPGNQDEAAATEPDPTLQPTSPSLGGLAVLGDNVTSHKGSPPTTVTTTLGEHSENAISSSSSGVSQPLNGVTNGAGQPVVQAKEMLNQKRMSFQASQGTTFGRVVQISSEQSVSSSTEDIPSKHSLTDDVSDRKKQTTPESVVTGRGNLPHKNSEPMSSVLSGEPKEYPHLQTSPKTSCKNPRMIKQIKLRAHSVTLSGNTEAWRAMSVKPMVQLHYHPIKLKPLALGDQDHARYDIRQRTNSDSSALIPPRRITDLSSSNDKTNLLNSEALRVKNNSLPSASQQFYHGPPFLGGSKDRISRYEERNFASGMESSYPGTGYHFSVTPVMRLKTATELLHGGHELATTPHGSQSPLRQSPLQQPTNQDGGRLSALQMHTGYKADIGAHSSLEDLMNDKEKVRQLREAFFAGEAATTASIAPTPSDTEPVFSTPTEAVINITPHERCDKHESKDTKQAKSLAAANTTSLLPTKPMKSPEKLDSSESADPAHSPWQLAKDVAHDKTMLASPPRESRPEEQQKVSDKRRLFSKAKLQPPRSPSATRGGTISTLCIQAITVSLDESDLPSSTADSPVSQGSPVTSSNPCLPTPTRTSDTRKKKTKGSWLPKPKKFFKASK